MSGTVDGAVSLPGTDVLVWGSERSAPWAHPTIAARVIAAGGGTVQPQAFPRATVSLECTISTPAVTGTKKLKDLSFVVAEWTLDGSSPGLPSLPWVVPNAMAPSPAAQLSLPLTNAHRTPRMKPAYGIERLSPSLTTENFRVAYELVVNFTSPRGPTDFLNTNFWFCPTKSKTEELAEEFGVPQVRLPVWVTDNPDVARAAIAPTSTASDAHQLV